MAIPFVPSEYTPPFTELDRGVDTITPPVALRCQNLTKIVQDGDSERAILSDINLTLYEGEFISVTGPSASGKTTLLNAISGLDTNITHGAVYDGEDPRPIMVGAKETIMRSKLLGSRALGFLGGLVRRDEEARRSETAQIENWRVNKSGIVFQDHNLLTGHTVGSNIEVVRDLAGKPIDQIWERHLLNSLGIHELMDKMPDKLSGGQRQRVSIARALLHKPEVLFLDEPTGNLDPVNARMVHDFLKELCETQGTTVVMVSHDINLTSQYCTRIISMAEGHIVSDVRTTDFTDDPDGGVPRAA